MIESGEDPLIAGRYGAPPFTRRRRIRRWIRTGALLTVVGLRPLARAVRARWRPLLAGGCSRRWASCGSTARAAWFSSPDCGFS